MSDFLLHFCDVRMLSRCRVSIIFLCINGQTKSKWIFSSDVSSKKRTNEFDFTIMISSGRLVFVRFLEEIDDPKNHFEINWPLAIADISCQFMKTRSLCRHCLQNKWTSPPQRLQYGSCTQKRDKTMSWPSYENFWSYFHKLRFRRSFWGANLSLCSPRFISIFFLNSWY